MVALLQIDAASVPLVERMLDEGRLPALAELKRRGRWERLERSTPLFVEAGSYVSLYSGAEVGDHGIYSAFQWSAAEQRIRFMDAFPAPVAVWERVSSAGGRSLVIDPYEGWPPEDAAGLRLLNGWQFRHKLLLKMSKPQGAQLALSRRLGRPPVVEHQYGRQSLSQLRAIRPHLLDGPGRAADAVERIASESPLDLLWVTFSAGHYAGHYYWDLSKTVAEDIDSAEQRELEDTVRQTYEAIDRAIARILAALPKSVDVIVLSPIGMGPETSRSDLLPAMLQRVLGERTGGPTREAAQSEAGGAIWRLRARVPLRVRQGLVRPLPGVAVRDLTARLHLRGTDWHRTRAFALPGDHYGYVRLNMRGRERDGIVGPEEARSLIDELTEGLQTFRDPDGTPSVEAVHRVADSVQGELSGQLPDLVVQWSARPSTGLEGVSSDRFGDIPRPGIGTGRSGNHTTDGWAVIAPGASTTREVGRAPRLTDLAATVCRLTGADESGLAGQPLLEPDAR